MSVKVNEPRNPNVRSNGQSKYEHGSGLPGFLGELRNWSTDAGRGLANFFGSSVPDYFTGNTTEEGHGVGDLAFGTQLPSIGKARGGGGMRQRNELLPSPTQGVPNPSGMGNGATFLDYLKMASRYMQEGGGGGTDWAALEAALKNNAAQSDARLGAMYNQLRGSIDADAPGIAQTYDTGISETGQHADQASGNIQEAYQAARDAQTDQFAKLGIGDAAAVLASQGGAAAADQANAVSGVEQNRATNQNQLSQNKGSALDYNTNIGNAAGLEGNLQRANLAQTLQNQLAELYSQKGQEQSGRSDQSFSLAGQLMQMDQQGRGGASAEDQQQLAEFLYGQQRDQAGDATAAQNAQRQTYLKLLQQYDGDSQAAAAAYAQLQAAGLV